MSKLQRVLALAAVLFSALIGRAATTDLAGNAIQTAGLTPSGAWETYVISLPTVTALSLTELNSAGGNTVTLTGTGFANVTAVKFGSTAATSFTVDNATTITAIAPAGTAGATGNVTVTTQAGTSATGSGNAFSYVASAVFVSTTSTSSNVANSAPGQSFTMPGTLGNASANKVLTGFNFLLGSTATGAGTAYLLDGSYAGLPGGLAALNGSSTPRKLATGRWNGSDRYVFPNVTLEAGVKYYVYSDSVVAADCHSGGDPLQGGEFHYSGSSGTEAFTSLATFDWSFQVWTVATAPTVTTANATNLAATSVTLGGNVTSDGGATITERGIVYSTSNTTPTTSDTKVAIGSGAGTFSQSVTGLTASTTYYVRAFATNSVSTVYGSAITVNTPSNNANLTALALSTGTLSPSFASGTTSYTASVDYSTTSLTVTPTAAAAATLTVNNTAVTSGAASQGIALNIGDNPITIVVTAQDGTTTKTYTAVVTRAASSADVAITATASPTTVGAGSDVTYTFTVTNNGPQDASDVSFSDTLPGGTTFVSLLAPNGWNAATPAGGTVAASTGSLASGATATFTLVVRFDSSLSVGTTISNTAVVSSDTSDPNSANNLATVSHTTSDITPPTLSSVTIASNNANTSKAKVGDTVTVSFTASETINTPTVTLAGRSATVANTSGNHWTATSTMASGDTEGVIAFNIAFADAAGNAATAVATTTNSSSVTFDKTAPFVNAIARLTPSGAYTAATSLTYRVTFSESVSGVDTSDFALTTTGTAAGSIASVTASSGMSVDVTVSSVSGAGTLRLDLNASGTGVADTVGNAIGGGFTTGETYTLAALIASTYDGITAGSGTLTVARDDDNYAGNRHAVPFTVGAAPYRVDALVANLRLNFGTGANVLARIYSDASGLPGAVVATLDTPALSTQANYTFTPGTTTTLSAGTTYWLVFEPKQVLGSVNATWFTGSSGNQSATAALSSSDTWNPWTTSTTPGAFQLFGTSTNSAPTLVLDSGNLAYTENDPLTVISPNATVTDSDGNWSGGRITAALSANFTTQSIELTTTTGLAIAGSSGNITISDNGTTFATGNATSVTGNSTLTFNLNASANTTRVQQIVRALSFRDTSEMPTNGASVTMGITDGATASVSATRNITITNVNDTPVLGNVTANATYTPGGSSSVLSSGLTASDVDAPFTMSATVTISAGGHDGDVLAATSTGTAAASYDATTRTLTISGVPVATFSDLQSVLRTVSYSSTASDPTNGGANATRTITWKITDGMQPSLVSNTPTTTISIADVLAPRIASITRQTPTTSPTGADSVTWRVTFNEAVQNVDAADFAVTGTTATVTNVSASSTTVYDVTVSGGDLASLNATVALGFASSQNITDLAGNAFANTTPTGTNDATFAIVNNRTPTDLALSPATINQSAAVAGATVGTLSTTDADSGDTHTYTFASGNGDTDNARFEITGATLKIKTSGSALTPGSYSVRITTTDSGNLAFTKALTITVADNVAPTITAANIALTSTPTGTNSTYRIGDTVTATWNNTTSGDNNSDIASVTFDFSQFGGGAAVAATSSGGTWTASHTILGGTIDQTNRNVAVTATDTAGNAATVTDDTNAKVDNVAPIVSAAKIALSQGTGPGSIFKIGDTLTVSWDNSASGDNNADLAASGAVVVDFSTFEPSKSEVAATSSSGTWTASYTFAQNGLEDTSGSVRVSVTDDAGNTTLCTVSNTAGFDGSAPRVRSIAHVTPITSGSTPNILVWRVTLDHPIGVLPPAALSLTKSGTATGDFVSSSSVDGSPKIFDVTYSVSGEGTLRLDFTGAGVTDSAGNAAEPFTSGEPYALGVLVAQNYDGVTSGSGRADVYRFSDGPWEGARRAERFAVGSLPYHLTAIVVPVAIQAKSGTFTATIHSDNAGLPGAALVDGTLSVPTVRSRGNFLLTPAAALTLDANTHYWLVLEPAMTGEPSFGWYHSAPAATGASAASSIEPLAGTTWQPWSALTGQTAAGFQVFGTVANTAPTLTVDSGTLAYTEDSAATALAPGAIATDAQANWNHGTLTAQLTSGAESTDVLALGAPADLTLDGTAVKSGTTTVATVSAASVTGSSTLTLTFNSATTNAHVQAIARALTFASTSQNPATTTRTATLTLTDSFGVSASTARSISVIAVNDAPTLTTVATLTGGTEDTAFTISHATLAANADEADVDSTTLSFAIAGVSSGTLTKNGSAVVAGATTLASGDSLVWTPAVDANGTTAAFTLQASDGTALSSNAITVNVALTEVNDAPTAANDSLDAIAEDSGPRTISFATLLANDSTGPANESAQTLTITSVTGATISDTNVTYTPAANYHGPASFTYTVSDNGTTNGSADAKTSTATVSFTITAVNDAPTDIALSNASVKHSAGAGAAVGALSSTDIDDTTFTYALVSGIGATDNASFEISGSTLRARNPASLAAGTYSVRIQADDGHAGRFVEAFSITVVDDVVPAAPSAPDLVAASDSGSSDTDNITKNTVLVFTGSAESGATVKLFAGTTEIGSATATGGTWTITANTLGEGVHAITATATDASSNTSVSSTALSITIDVTAPTAPALTTISDDTGVAGDLTTRDTTLILSGTADADSTVTVARVGTGAIGPATPNSSGAWSFDYSATTLAAGEHSFTVVATDVAGNASAPSGALVVTIDTATPNAPVIASISNDSGRSSTDGVTNDATLTLTGTAEANSRVTLSRSTVGELGAVTADASGNWTYDYTGTTLVDGSYIFTATAKDSAGNTSAASADFPVVVDTTAPVITATTASGTYGSAFTYNVAATGSAVSYAATGLPAGLSLASETGAITGTPTETGSFTVSLSATDAAGNTGAATLALTIAKVELTVAGITASSRTYDRTEIATLNLTNAALVGVVDGDATGVSLVTTGASGTFASKAAGTGKSVNVAGLTLAGAKSAHYSLTQPTLTADITPKPLSVSGITAASKTYDGSTGAALSFSGAALVGVLSGDTVGLVTSGATGTFSAADAGTHSVVVSGIALNGADAANYTLTLPSLSASITPASVTFAFGNLSHVYDGAQKAATVSASPSLPVSLSYSATPISAGSYHVTASASSTNYAGSASATLTIAKATQTVSFNVPTTAELGTPVSFTASASSGLPVAVAVVSGSATVSGANVTLNDANPVTLRATQAGSENYAAASAERTITATGKLAQTITFAALGDRRANDAAFTLSATASSGLPVTFAVVSGPAMLNGNTLAFTGVAGRVVVRASQPGNATYHAAPDVTQTFNVSAVTNQVFFGATQNNNPVGVNLAPSGTSGTMICFIDPPGEAFVVSFTLNPDRTFESVVAPLNANSTLGGTSGATPPRAAAAAPRTFRGQLAGGVITGAIVELGIKFSASVQPPSGPTANIAGFYQAASTNTATGNAYSVVGTQGQVLVVAVTPNVTAAGTAMIAEGNAFAVQTSATTTISGTIDSVTTTVTGNIAVAGKPTETFAGTNAGTTRTDRLINLSSRVRVGPSGGRTLITGFVIGGTEEKRVLLRAIGPALSGFGVSGVLSNPRLQLYNGSGRLLAENDDWSGADTSNAFNQVGAFGLGSASRDAAILTTLAPGAYSMHVIDGGETGIALAEIYDASVNPGSEYQRLVNISTRGMVEPGDGVLVGGFVITGNSPKRVLIRGIGPSLAGFGVTGTLADPRLAVYSGQTIVAQNDDWGRPTPISDDQAAATAEEIATAAQMTGAFAFAAGTRDAAVIITLAPGAYTAQVSGANGTSGVALVEVYEIP